MASASQRTIGTILYPRFELLDVFGPLEAYGMLPDRFRIVVVAEKAGPVASNQGPTTIAEFGFDDSPQLDILLVPGGLGTREELDNPRLLSFLKARTAKAEYATSVCTGSALYARAGLLDGKRATSNKMVFAWVAEQGPAVKWVKEARWVEDGKMITSSGVSAGIDMTLALIAKLEGMPRAEQAAVWMEYEWHRDANWDPFAKIHKLV
jgi:transcriptional regulator GlxA family with amidase domain